MAMKKSLEAKNEINYKDWRYIEKVAHNFLLQLDLSLFNWLNTLKLLKYKI